MRLRTNNIEKKRALGEVPTGLVVQLGCPDVVEMAGVAGFDYVWIDSEHGSFDIETAVQMFRAADAVGITPLLRVPSHDRSFIMRALDGGAMGILVPNVETREQAEALVAAAKYFGEGHAGTRGACPGTRAAWHQAQDWPNFVRWSNQNTAVWLIVESPTGVANIDEIASVPGVDAIVMGSFDLAQAMGLNGDITQPEVQRAHERVIESTARHGVDLVANMFVLNPEDLAAQGSKWVDEGATILCVGSDRRMFAHALASRADALSRRSMKCAPRTRPPVVEAISDALAGALTARD